MKSSDAVTARVFSHCRYTYGYVENTNIVDISYRLISIPQKLN